MSMPSLQCSHAAVDSATSTFALTSDNQSSLLALASNPLSAFSISFSLPISCFSPSQSPHRPLLLQSTNTTICNPNHHYYSASYQCFSLQHKYLSLSLLATTAPPASWPAVPLQHTLNHPHPLPQPQHPMENHHKPPPNSPSQPNSTTIRPTPF